METDFEADSYFGLCSICGHFQEFKRSARSIRETYRCAQCKALLREREQAQSILACYDSLRASTLSDLVEKTEFRHLHIYEPGTIGPFRRLFKGLPHYQQSDYYPEEQRSQAPLEVPHQSLEELGFADASFDLVITSDILEHVRKPERAFAEIARVLKPGGYHVFTVPLQEPLPAKTIARVDTSGDTDKPLLPEYYHGNGKGGRSLVYTDFGADIMDMLSSAGFVSHLRRPSTASAIVNRAITVVSKRRLN